MTTQRHTWIAFLRAVNLGATRKFPKDELVAAVERAGGTDVATYLNTGNVRFDHPLTERAEVEALLEETFAADRGFEVQTICATPAELAVIAGDAAAVRGDHEGPQFVFLCRSPGDSSAREELVARAGERDTVHVIGRSVHLLSDDYHRSKISNAVVERHLGTSTSRNLNVIRTLAERWG